LDSDVELAWFKENQTKERKKEFKSKEKGSNLIIQEEKTTYTKRGGREIIFIAILNKKNRNFCKLSIFISNSSFSSIPN